MPGRRPVERGAGGVQSAQCGEQGAFLGCVPAERGDGDRLVGERFAGHGGEDPIGAEFQEGADALGLQGRHTVGEADGLADVSHPVLGRAQLFGRSQPAREVGHHGEGRRCVGQSFRDGAEVVQHRVHQRRVEGVADPQAGGATSLVGEVLRDGPCGFIDAGDDHRGGPVDRGDRQVVGEVREDLVLRGLDGDHRTTRRKRLHQPSTSRHQPARIRQRQHARDVRRGDLTDGVAATKSGRTPQLSTRRNRATSTANSPGCAQPVSFNRSASSPTSPPAAHLRRQLRIQAPKHRIQHLGEHREPAVQLTPHPQPLRTLAREQHRAAAGCGVPVRVEGSARRREGGEGASPRRGRRSGRLRGG
ncbi:hypothetical protein SALB_00289 [Streptomyces noursei]|uniref:Uncharacterized protein n=1 Tax=Streptomyces noursei TaxID=1971 RepID=A0A401QQQ6_STRNR|nr:hypothetical protein SALB_00289 [Streptomyces noursei]